MSHFETRLTEALTSGAEEAPAVDRLAAGARTRARSRQRVRRAAVATAAVAALAVPVALAMGGGDRSADGVAGAADPTGDAGAWRTVEHRGVLTDIPDEWVRLDTSSCLVDEVRYGPRGSDPCAFDHEAVGIYRSVDIDPYRGPGVVADPETGWTGYVRAGDQVVLADAADKDVVRRILASAREVGQEAPDLSAGWRTESYGGLSVDVPADWKDGPLSGWCLQKAVLGWVETPDTVGADVDCAPPYSGFGVRFHNGATGGSPFKERGEPRFPEHSWAGVAIVPDEVGEPIGHLQVVAPTQGLAELIGGSLRVQ